jgi:hypothetical protein
MRYSLILSVVLFLTNPELIMFGARNDSQLISHINTLDKQSICHLSVRKIFEGDTDRGMEATLHECADSMQRIEIIFGLSRKDLILRYFLVSGGAAKAEVFERKYRSTADGNADFNSPLPPTSRGILYFDGVKLLSFSSNQMLDITDKDKNAKALAFMNLVNAVRAALLSNDPHPEFDSISFLTGVFGNR